MDKKNILVLTTSFPRFKGDHSGIFVKSICESICNNNNCTVIAPQNGKIINPYNAMYKVINFRYFIPKCLQTLCYGDGIIDNIKNNYLNIVLVPFFLASFYLTALKYRKSINIIHSHWIFPSGLIGAILSRKYNIKHIITVHSGGLFLLTRLPLGTFILKFIYQHSDQVVCVSQELKRKIVDFLENSDKIIVLPTGIDLNDDHQNKDNIKNYSDKKSLKVLFIGRLIKIKGIEYLIKAVSQINNVTLYIAGDGKRQNRLKKLASQLNVKAEFLGFVSGDKKREVFEMIDIVVVPSIVLGGGRSEGVPVVILESFKFGKPVIGSNIGGIPDVLEDGINGFLFEPCNILMLKNKLEYIQNNLKLRRAMSNNAKKSAKKYELMKCVRKYEKLFNDI